MRATLRTYEGPQYSRILAGLAINLSEVELVAGEVASAIATARDSVARTDQIGDPHFSMLSRATLTYALVAAGDAAKGESLFAEAERRQKECEPECPWLYSLRGYEYSDLLLSQGDAVAARERAATNLERYRQNYSLLSVALDTLTLGRANFLMALTDAADPTSAKVAGDGARAKLDEAVEVLRRAGQMDEVPVGLLARAAFSRAVGGWEGAAHDCDDAHEIAEPGPMRLHLCDLALERARLVLARREAFAPLNGLVEPSPPPPALPDAAEAARLLEEARNELDTARKLVADCGYHRRDAELAELDAVVAGRCRFAELSPRV